MTDFPVLHGTASASSYPAPAKTATSRPPRSLPKFKQRDTFQGYMRSRVDRYFRITRQKSHGGGRMVTKTLIITAWVIASYLSLILLGHFWPVAIVAALSLGVGVAAVGFNIQHDAGHKAYFHGKKPNRFMALSLDLMGGSSFLWNIKHNKLHHTYTNIEGHDDDIDVGILARLSPHQPRLWFHRFQHFYLWALYAGLAIKWQCFDDFRDIARGRIGDLTPVIYRLKRERAGAFTDVTNVHSKDANVFRLFNNGLNRRGGSTYVLATFGHDTTLAADEGWDDTTGVGSPDARFLTVLVRAR